MTTLAHTGPLPVIRSAPAVVAMGGGHGLAVTLAALRHLTPRLTAVVTVADDGGSSGRLRQEFAVLPPGDLRMALAALTDESEWGRVWRDVLQHRFDSSGELSGHALGNLLIVALWQLLGNPCDALELIGRLLGASGRVLPMAEVPLTVEADITRVVEDGEEWTTTIRGQHRVAVAGGRVDAIRLDPADAPACPEAVAALSVADWIVLGPGSWYTSVIPHVLIPELASAIATSKARKMVVLNLTGQAGETAGFSPVDHLAALSEYAPMIEFDVILADTTLREGLASFRPPGNGRVLIRNVKSASALGSHDELRLASAYRDAFGEFDGSSRNNAHQGGPGWR